MLKPQFFKRLLGGMLPAWIEPIIASLAVSLIVMLVVSNATWREDTGTPRLYGR